MDAARDAMKSMAEKTTSTLGGLGSAISSKFGGVRENATFKSFEERISATVGAVRGKVDGTRSSSTQDFDEALKEVEGQQQRPGGGEGDAAGVGYQMPPQQQPGLQNPDLM